MKKYNYKLHSTECENFILKREDWLDTSLGKLEFPLGIAAHQFNIIFL